MKKILLVFMILACMGSVSAGMYVNEKMTFNVGDIIFLAFSKQSAGNYKPYVIQAILPYENGFVLKLYEDRVYEFFVMKDSVLYSTCFKHVSENPESWRDDPNIPCIARITNIQPNSFTVLFQELK